MSKEEYAKLCYLLGKIKYELIKILAEPNLSKLTRNRIEKQIREIEDIAKICIIGDSNE